MRPLAIISAATALLWGCSQAEVPTADTPQAPRVELPTLQGEHLWNVDYSESMLIFRGTQNGEGFEGRFEDWRTEVNLDPADLSDARLRARVDLASARTGDPDRDGALPGADWFDTVRFPEAVFESESISSTGPDMYLARGTLDLKGVRQAVELPFTLDLLGDMARAEATATLDRSLFGVGQGDFATGQWVAFPVEVEARIVASRGDGS